MCMPLSHGEARALHPIIRSPSPLNRQLQRSKAHSAEAIQQKDNRDAEAQPEEYMKERVGGDRSGRQAGRQSARQSVSHPLPKSVRQLGVRRSGPLSGRSEVQEVVSPD